MSEPSSYLVKALVHLLRPLVRLLIHYQLTYPYMVQLLKSLYVDEASKIHGDDNKPPNDSRVSVLTGVHRKDVRRLRQLDDPLMQMTQHSTSLGAEVVANWCSLEDYIDHDGKPLALHRLASQGEPSFESLVELVSRQDLRARSLLDEWNKKQIVTLDKDDMVCLNESAFVANDDFNDKAYFFGRNTHDHIAASFHNLQGLRPALFDRCVYYNNLSPDSIDKLTQLSKTRAQQVILEVNREARKLQRSDKNAAAESRQRFHFGAFHFIETQDNNNE